MQGVIKSYDPSTGDGSVVSDTTLAEFDLASDALEGSIFRSNHASNALALEGTLPRDKARLLAELDEVLSRPEHSAFVPRWLRGL